MLIYNCNNAYNIAFIYERRNSIKAGLYARVSTDIQVEGYSIEAQKEFLENYAKGKGYTEFEYYVDGGFSGKDLNRPEIQRLINDVKEHKIDCVMVFKLDRISRSQRDTLYLIEEVFNKYDVGFVSIRENFDTTSPFGKAMIGILSVFAQLERETIMERTRIGLKKRIQAGYWRAGGKIPFGYTYSKEEGTLIPNPEEVEVINKMISLYLEGKSFGQISEVVGFDESLVEKRLLNKTYTGIVKYNGEEYDGKHEAIVSKKVYDRILEVNKIRSKTRTERHYLFSGKIYCGHCGAKYRYQKWGQRTICYCYSQQKSKPKYIKDPNCKAKRWDSFELDDEVIESIFSMALDENLFKENYQITQVNIALEYQNKLSKIDKQLVNLLDFISVGLAVEITKEKIEKLEKEREDLFNKLNEIQTKEKSNKNNLKIIKNLQTTWFDMDFSEKRFIIEQIVDKVIINDNGLDIYYKIS